MAAPIPKTKAEEVFEQLCVLLDHRDRINEFTLAKLRRDARASLSVDPVVAHVALGAIASMEWDDEGADYHHREAIRYQDDSMTRMNYSISLLNLQRAHDAWLQVCIAADAEPADLELQRRAIKAGFLAGEFSDSQRRIDLYAKRSPGRPYEDAERIAQVTRILAERNISEASVRQMIDTALGVLRDHKVENHHMQVRAIEEPGDKSVMYAILIDRPKAELVQLERDLVDRLYDSVDALDFSAFWIGYDQEAVHAD